MKINAVGAEEGYLDFIARLGAQAASIGRKHGPWAAIDESAESKNRRCEPRRAQRRAACQELDDSGFIDKAFAAQ
jgi:hypothetical protein